MNAQTILETSEQKVDHALHVYTQDKRADPTLHEWLIDDLTRATIEYLELRERVLRGQTH